MEGGGGESLKDREIMRKSTFFTPPSLSGEKAGSLRPINYWHLPRGVARKLYLQVCAHRASASFEDVGVCVCAHVVCLPLNGNWLHRETDDSHSLRLNRVTSVTRSHSCALMCFACR